MSRPAKYWTDLGGGKIRCDVCPRDCTLAEGQRGLCFVRKNEGGALQLTTWGRSSGLCIDPIEKKPLSHFYPGSSVLSLGTAGCNLVCKFCQNWHMSKSKDMDTLAAKAEPEAIAQAAVEHGCKSVAFTYNDPAIFLEYAMDIADACHARGVQTVAVSAGYMHATPRRDFYEKIDAVNIDLKAFTEDFYRKVTGGHLGPVLETLEYLAKETDTWLEVTTLLIPGHNDSDNELSEMAAWFVEVLGPDVPWHFSAFHPDFRMPDVPRTPLSTLNRARAIARAAGVKHTYSGNVHDRAGDTTRCGHCDAELIVRDWYTLVDYCLDAQGRCPQCSTPLPGRFDAVAGEFGRRRVRLRLH